MTTLQGLMLTRVTATLIFFHVQHSAAQELRTGPSSDREDQRGAKDRTNELAPDDPRWPFIRLGQSYFDYIVIKSCREHRDGYLVTYISEPEFNRAKQAVKRLEDLLKPKMAPTSNVDSIWDSAVELAAKYRPVREHCRAAFNSLIQRYKILAPSENKIEKDF
jgi:hypothetical protein